MDCIQKWLKYLLSVRIVVTIFMLVCAGGILRDLTNTLLVYMAAGLGLDTHTFAIMYAGAFVSAGAVIFFTNNPFVYWLCMVPFIFLNVSIGLFIHQSGGSWLGLIFPAYSLALTLCCTPVSHQPKDKEKHVAT